ncbi:hypothetical protein ACFFWE_26160 [Sphaerisporangium melleum]|nr:hypothetical protein [Sphaerisporangium melleum]
MERGFDMTHGTLRAAATHLGVHGEEYASAVRRLLDNDPRSWGDDGLMGPFVSAYAECKNVALATYTHMGDVITGTGDGLSAASVRVSAIEDDTAGGVLRLGEDTGTAWT